MATKPYEERTDLEKCRSQWTKLQGLHTREEWSAAIVRAATAAEIAANYAIRTEFANQSALSAEFVNKMLAWANGLRGKLTNLLVLGELLFQAAPNRSSGVKPYAAMATFIFSITPAASARFSLSSSCFNFAICS